MNFYLCVALGSYTPSPPHNLSGIICFQLGLLRPMRETLQKYGRSNLR